jgi:YesN/AraC family two-component response regulator
MYILNENEAAFMMNFSIHDEQQIQKTVSDTLQKMSKDISSNFSIMPIFGVGNQCTSIMELQTSLNEAEQVLNRFIEQATKETNVFWHKDIITEKVVYYYPNSIEQKLINCTKLGNYEDAALLLNEVYEQNYTKRFLSGTMEKMLHNDMSATIIKLLEDINLDMDHYNLNSIENTSQEEFFDKIKKVYEDICRAIANTRKDHNVRFIEEILEFVELNYTDSNMCVYMVASKFGLSESYFSQFFKENAGVNFSSYVENARIQKACELINTTSMSLDEISSQVGYNNTHTFRRAFKKVIGVVPSAYKK